jgi:transcriptional regulator with XRE-family HTH domain
VQQPRIEDRGMDLGTFLKSCRSRVKPADLGLDHGTKNRRVMGLRREEVAHLAGVSVNYYTRLEQGQSRNASPEVLDALARALQLDGDERAHIHALARPAKASGRTAPPRPEHLRAAVAGLVDAFDRGPSVIIGRLTDVLAWNRMAQFLLTDHLGTDGAPERPGTVNLIRFIFLDPYAQRIYPDWIAEARDIVAYLRMTAGRYPADPDLFALIDELAARSSTFRELWSVQMVRDKTHGVRVVYHPVVGRLTLEFETLRLPDAPDQCLVVYRAKPGSTSAAGLQLLRGVLTGELPEPGRGHRYWGREATAAKAG